MITILMPLYNGVEFLSESVGSIQAQTYSDWELIIGVNGWGRNSEVFQQALKFGSKKIFITELDTVGKADTLNALLDYATTDWVCLLDADDYWLPTKLEKQLQYTHFYDVIGSWCQYFGSRSDHPNIPLGEVSPKDFMQGNPIVNSSSMFRVEDAHWDSRFEVEDYEMWLRLNYHGKKFYNIPEKLVYHRIYKQSFFNTRVFNLDEVRALWPV